MGAEPVRPERWDARLSRRPSGERRARSIAKRRAAGRLVRAGGIEPPRAYAQRIFAPLRLSPPPRAGFVVRTIPSPWRTRFRRCPSSLYTSPNRRAARVWLGIAISQGSPNLSSSAAPVSRRALSCGCAPSPLRLPFRHARMRSMIAGSAAAWRLRSESNRRTRLCRPLHDHSATQPGGGGSGSDPWWSGKPGSNRRPQPWQGYALPTELFPLRDGGNSATDPARCQLRGRTARPAPRNRGLSCSSRRGRRSVAGTPRRTC